MSKFKTHEKSKEDPLNYQEENMIIKLRNGNVALEEIVAADRTTGGIYIPQTAAVRSHLRHGKVFDVGPGELVQGQFVKMDIEKGDDVIFDSSRSEVIEIDGKKLTICNMVDIIATVPARHLSVVPPAPIPNETA
jgi:co-chaperonin GroES (HSP10)